ncbi:MAG TPA: TIGR03619 family F420-dependent LLM class oxidoreductase [Myxococcota bacterium]|nr:TIGR03619 family F420-dependent LLM class oxidoreductase [Myxococcota bacterium]
MRFVVALAFSDLREYCEIARVADECGYAYLAVSDHVVHPETIRSPYPYSPDGAPRWQPEAPWADPWVAIGAMAGVTERIRFTTNIFVLAMRNPFLAAKAIATAAEISGGRVSLGVGVGWMEDEFELLGQSFRDRGRRTDELLGILPRLWSGGMVEHAGRDYAFPRLQMSPRVAAPIPVYVGGLSEPALRRAARHDGWISDLHTVDEVRELRARIEGHRRAQGTADRPFQLIAALSDAFDLDGYRRAAEAGVTHVMTQPWIFHGGPDASLDRKCDGLRRFADDVLGPLGS